MNFAYRQWYIRLSLTSILDSIPYVTVQHTQAEIAVNISSVILYSLLLIDELDPVSVKVHVRVRASCTQTITTGLKQLSRLETLSLAHNILKDAVFTTNCPLSFLLSLKKLDLSRNLLTGIPQVIGNLQWYE